MSAPELVLASTSRYRRALLERLGLPFRCEAPGVDEEAAKVRGLGPEGVARLLARAKAEAVSARWPGAVVIGSDQVCALGDEALGKPGGRDRAVAQLARLCGREHRLVTAVAVVGADGVQEVCDVTRLWMRGLTQDEIGRYVDADEPWDCAGSYKLEQRGIALFERIESADFTAIEGLPLMAVARLLRGVGYRVP